MTSGMIWGEKGTMHGISIHLYTSNLCMESAKNSQFQLNSFQLSVNSWSVSQGVTSSVLSRVGKDITSTLC